MGEKSVSSTMKLIIFILILGVLSLIVGYYAEWLWFDSVDFAGVFTTILLSKIALYVILFILGFIVFYGNLQITRKNMGDMDYTEHPKNNENEEGREVIYLNQEKPSPWKNFMKGRGSKWFFLGLSLFGALLVSSAATGDWITVQQYLHRVTVGIADPVFNKDLGFYFFNLSFYQFVYSVLMSTAILVTLIVGVVYALNASSDLLLGDWRQFTVAKSHLAILVACILALKAWGYRLAAYSILFSSEGIIYGASYTDIHARLVAYKALLLVSLIVAAIILINLFIKRLNWIFISLGAWVVIAVVMGGIYPYAIQKLVVQPNEYNKEKPYIERAIKYTRSAYALDQADIQQFPVGYDLDINHPANKATIDNIRLWDWQPLKTTYKNLQQLRPQYVFNDVDIDRYTIDGEYRQIMLSARELDRADMAADSKTWINERLMYTHGYGVVASPVNEIAQEGFPRFFIKDIPPHFSTDLKVERPEIYFGERTNDYIIVNTEQKEFDYPMGDNNIYSMYEGKKGIKLNSYGKRILYSWVLKDYKMLLSSDINNDSQVLLNRNIMSRVSKVAPYLGFDQDPYIVINDDGRLYWIIDAYTYTDKYPYSMPFNEYGYNYMRNAVKVTMDAYTGEMNFYVADVSDPVIKTFEGIFPGVYKPLAEMPEGLKKHIRYPEDLFQIQANMFRTYHMTDPNVFYNKEDIWLIPKETVDDKAQEVEPYYIVMRLPGEEKAEYVMMIPFTPRSRQNMVGWMCARMDGDNYGKMLVYNFPKQETIYGPEQIESRIDQNTEISQQLSLWDQRGSRVYRGNLLVIPIDNSILYVEPLYLQADKSSLPELKRVIVAFGNNIVMEQSLDKALEAVFGEKAPSSSAETEGGDKDVSAEVSIKELANMAREYYDQAQQKLQEGDWAGYGRYLGKLDEVIRTMEKATSP